ncbi:hypothetical protein HOD19_03220 [bacterium]|jgi:hypothetical protein|nr:hypothetical protein [bacterium]MBT4649210.1 hypothetical protein [bacterium]
MKNIRKMFADCLFNQKTAENNGRFYGFSDLDVEKKIESKRKTSHKWLVFHEEKRF